MCCRCLKVVHPSNISQCANVCTNPPQFTTEECNIHPTISKIFGRICMYCTPNFTIKSIDCNFTSQVDSPPHSTNLFTVQDSIITHNPLGIYKYDSGSLQNIISGDTVLLGGSGSNVHANVTPSSIIKKIESTASELRFYITPPLLHIPVAPYLHQI